MNENSQSPKEHDPVRWFDQHYTDAADEIIKFLGEDGITLEGKDVIDVGAGEGIIALGLAQKAKPRSIIGYDIRPTNERGLQRMAAAAGVGDALPDSLRFEQSDPTELPAADGSVDIAVSWSVFEHVDDPIGLLSDIHRVLRPEGLLFVQLWPLYLSEHGGHLWMHYDEPFPHLLKPDEEILAEIGGTPGTDPTRPADDEYRSLNRITLAALQRALLATGFVTTKLKLLTTPLHIPVELSHVSFADIGIGGVQLAAVPR